MSDRGNTNDGEPYDVESLPSSVLHGEHVAIDHHLRLRLDSFCRMASLLNSAYDSLWSTFRRGLIKVLAAGPVPQHIAFVMDGNRRYARQRNMAIKQGHTDGFNALRQVCPSLLSLFFSSAHRLLCGMA